MTAGEYNSKYWVVVMFMDLSGTPWYEKRARNSCENETAVQW